jgi:Xaa-Pro dipeptidase
MDYQIKDPICSAIEKRLPASRDDPEIIQIAQLKVKKLRDWMNSQKFDAVLLSRCDNFAWLTVGGDNHVVMNTEFGVGHLLITAEAQYLLAYSMDGPRLMEEQIPGQGYALITSDWYAGDPRLKMNEQVTGRIASDSNFQGTQDISAEIYLLHDPMTDLELDRLRWLGRTTGLVFEKAASIIHPGLTEWEIASILTSIFRANQIELDVLLVGTDDRARTFRHFIPTGRKLEKYVLMNPAARRWGLHANVSRCINFGPLDKEIGQSYAIAAAVLTEMMATVGPDTEFSGILDKMRRSFTNQNLSEGWKQHFPGGVTGYVLADSRCLTDLKMIQNQAYDWFATMPGIMIEELSILGSTGLEIPSLGEKWPLKNFGESGNKILLPDIFVTA